MYGFQKQKDSFSLATGYFSLKSGSLYPWVYIIFADEQYFSNSQGYFAKNYGETQIIEKL